MTEDELKRTTLSGEPIQSCPVYDVHGHIGTSRNTLVGELGDQDAHDRFNSIYVDVEDQRRNFWPRALPLLLEAMDATGVDRMVFSHLDAIAARTEEAYFRAHREAEEAIWLTEKRMLGYVVYAPHFVSSSEVQLKRIEEKGSGFVGVKVHCEVHDTRIADRRFDRLFQHLQHCPCPVLIHAHPLDDINEIATRAKSVPNSTFIMAHLWPGEQLAGSLTKECPNVFIDMCASRTPIGQLERMVKEIGADRLLYGSDATYLSLGAQLAKVTLSALSESDKQSILYRNASRVFGKHLTNHM